MCGIAGFFTPSQNPTKEELVAMTDTLRHRGPDASGYFFQDNVGLGHRRLRILDLSDDANMPMTDSSGRYVMIYNGEVYNYRELSIEVDRLKTTSDSEVILEHFAKSGVQALKRFNGMFAIAIYDKQERRLFLARDRMGIKPLYYYWDGQNIAFASELKALLKLGFIANGKKVNKTAVNEFMLLGYVPEPHSIYENIYKLPSGSYAWVDAKGLTIERYWRLEDYVTDEKITDLNDAKRQLRKLIRTSVEFRLRSDVPYGTFLSGGIDSSLVTAVAQEVNQKPISTFSIGFKEGKYNESDYARKVAEHIGTDHHEFIVSHRDAMELIEKMPEIYDEPFADSSGVPTLLVSKLAREHVTVALSGDGGDETYLGYGSYRWANRFSNPLVRLFRKPASLLFSKLSSRYQRIAQLLQYDDFSKIKSHIFSQESYYCSRNELQAVLQPDWRSSIRLDEDYSVFSSKLSPVEQQAFFDLKYYLKDDLLTKVDRASMFHALEVRVPLLDHSLVEFALKLDQKLKVHGNTSKVLLKELLYDYVPKSIFNRPKWGFSIPLAEWMKSDLRYLIEDYLNPKVVDRFGLFDPKLVSTLQDRFFHGSDYLYNRLWQIIVLHSWFEKNT